MTIHPIILALGSNVPDAANKLEQALTLCKESVSVIKVTPVIETTPVGIISPNFLNMMVSATTTLSLSQLSLNLKAVEKVLGREKSSDKRVVEIDIDIMKYDDTLLHVSDWKRDYITILISQL